MEFTLPKDSRLNTKSFTFGVATASFQIEGSTNADGRCESIWDRFCATPGKVLNGDDGSVACEHYTRLEEDLDLIKSLGVDAYRFSIAWPRIEPKPGQWNEAGFDFYERLVDGLIARGIKPYATLYHWDLPQYLEDKGGWINRETAYLFSRYAEKLVERLGDKVVSYATFNEPFCSAYLGYRWGIHAPGLKDDRLGFQAAHHLMLAHGLAIPLMRKHAPKAQLGIVLNINPAFPASDSEADKQATQLSNDDSNHTFLGPILAGKYPTSVFEKYPHWAPTQLQGDLDIINAPLDFLGINYYTGVTIKADAQGEREEVNQQVPKTDIGWDIIPEALTKALVDYKNTYPSLPPIYITENGAADNTECINGEVNDTMRTDYYQQHLMAVHNAIEQGVDVQGYFAWSLMDNFEWAFGYSQRFGIVHVDYSTQKRTVKLSGLAWKKFLANR
ncbi:GH1 family beta-glucosidase [Reinekea marina]|uniref:Beta-glucosidase n=1 Tax=Reinekea marina TaxID=1310421 RepID=A0ABV7WUX9_9GAMM|nr:GH1 family beta-glucosidase [Reinekea marina]MDN3648035.1 GH1 family beta-glucosidase [Reinekea marina]